jgi:two-component system, OmpR family, sensor histidine kinase VicK
LPDIEVIPSSARAQDRYLDIVKTAKEEILWIFPTTNAFLRQDKMGAIPLAIQAAKREENVKVRILVPASSLIEQRVQQLKEEYCYCHTDSDEHTIIIDVRNIEQMSETKATILVVDRKAYLVMELRDDSKTTFSEAIGLSTYSNSKAGVLSYVAIFENLWRQSELYEQLKLHDKMQREFINIAAHELRTPIQPIIGLTQVVHSKIKDPQILELQEVIIRNAKRLHQLTEDILDVSRVEGHQSLQLNKERFNLSELILHIIEDFKINVKNRRSKEEKNNSNDTNLKLKFGSNNNKKDIFIVADKGRITQVISNLLSNAVKFTQDDGIIYINLEQKEEKDDEVVISIKDTGQGIDPSIQNQLFEKFTTRSEKGIGLGLYLSRKIVEAHGGRIWGENNNNRDGERGATFYFSLPLSNEEQVHKKKEKPLPDM